MEERLLTMSKQFYIRLIAKMKKNDMPFSASCMEQMWKKGKIVSSAPDPLDTAEPVSPKVTLGDLWQAKNNTTPAVIRIFRIHKNTSTLRWYFSYEVVRSGYFLPNNSFRYRGGHGTMAADIFYHRFDFYRSGESGNAPFDIPARERETRFQQIMNEVAAKAESTATSESTVSALTAHLDKVNPKWQTDMPAKNFIGLLAIFEAGTEFGLKIRRKS